MLTCGKKVKVKNGTWAQATISDTIDVGFYTAEHPGLLFYYEDRGYSWQLGTPPQLNTTVAKKTSVSTETIDVSRWRSHYGSAPQQQSVTEWCFLVYTDGGRGFFCKTRQVSWLVASRWVHCYAKQQSLDKVVLVAPTEFHNRLCRVRAAHTISAPGSALLAELP